MIAVFKQAIQDLVAAALHTIDALDREVRTAIDVRERLAALEARRPA